ncbi:MAG: ATP synthase F0 subunit A [Bacteroidia bacterium]|nr:MAG: ATP synthase F0 subunit A [Bacteroidia bacterium]
MKRNYLLVKILFILLTATFLGNTPSWAESEIPHEANSEETHHEDEKFNPGDLIMGHIGDEYGWHITTIGEKHITIPLPVILYSKHSGFHVFMSDKLGHGHDSYKGFYIAKGDKNPNKGKIVETVNNIETRPYDISITKNTLSLFISLILILYIFISVAKAYQKREGKAPKGLQSFLEPLILFIRDDVAKAALGEKRYMKFTPYLLSIFFFIFLNNLLGLIPIFPGGANLTGNIAITMTLAAFTFVIILINSNKNYWQHIFNAPGVPWWLKLPIPLMPLVEFTGIFIKPFVLMVRLFANISAGHIVALGFFSLIFIFGEMGGVPAGIGGGIFSVAFTVFLTFLELLVAFIQAYVFTLLSALYFDMATEEHH